MIEKGEMNLVVFTNEDIYEKLEFSGDWTGGTFTSKLLNPITGTEYLFTIPTPTYSSITGLTTVYLTLANSIVSTLSEQIYKYDLLITSLIKKVYVFGEIEIRLGIS